MEAAEGRLPAGRKSHDLQAEATAPASVRSERCQVRFRPEAVARASPRGFLGPAGIDRDIHHD
jgi:hypothetical protein